MTLRVPMVSLDRARELGEAMGLPARRTQSEAFRVLANNPGVARVAYNQLIQLLENNKFDTRLRELMIMRIGWVTGSAYEWTQHWRVATTAGIPQDDILAVRDWRNSERLTPADKAILAATDECLDGKSISDAAWAEVVKHVASVRARHRRAVWNDEYMFQLLEVWPEVGDGLRGRRRRIVGVSKPPPLQPRSDTPCPMLTWSSCFNQGRLPTRSPRCCATERAPCWRRRLRQKWPNFSPSTPI
jgi:alkylhydroperoxidase family enzyme